MKGVFVELPPFARNRAQYMDDENFADLQQELLNNPEAGAVIQDTGGLRKLRFRDAKKGKGKRGGLRIIYYWWVTQSEFLLFTAYRKGEVVDLTPEEKKALSGMLEAFKAERR